MRILVFAILVLSLNAFASFVAVLETVSVDSAITVSEGRFLTDELRSQAGVALPPYMGYTIMTRENINVMLPPGKTLEECEGSCIAETGRNIAADYVVQARVGKFGNKLTLTVELYETGSGKLLGSYTALQVSATDLWNDIKQNSKSLFSRIQDATRSLGDYGSEKSGWDASPFEQASNKPKPEKKSAEAPKIKSFYEDRRDGTRYKVVVIGKKAWFAENLKYNVRGSECYNSSPTNCNMYGRYYTWSQAMAADPNCDAKECVLGPAVNIRGACPEGWHIPTVDEWQKLVSYVNRKSNGKPAKVMKSTYIWDKGGTNDSKFNAVPAGYRFQSGNFMGLGKTTRFWTSNPVNPVEAYAWELRGDANSPNLIGEYKSNEISVRCVADD